MSVNRVPSPRCVSAIFQRLSWARVVYDAVAGADFAGRTDGEVASSIGSARDAAGVGAWTSVMLSACAGVAARVMLSGCATANRTAAEATKDRKSTRLNSSH